jgi:hypothetical protein
MKNDIAADSPSKNYYNKQCSMCGYDGIATTNIIGTDEYLVWDCRCGYRWKTETFSKMHARNIDRLHKEFTAQAESMKRMGEPGAIRILPPEKPSMLWPIVFVVIILWVSLMFYWAC